MEAIRAGLAALEAAFGQWVVDPLSAVIFFDLWFWDAPGADGIALPIVVVWLILGATFFTLRFRFVNLRAFRHAIDCVRGRYDHEGDRGEISHFQALSAALSATVGLGNIAGVAVAIGLGGPGAVFWMMAAGFLGMSSKFAECTLAQRYRVVRADGHVAGGPMYYLKQGLGEQGFPRLGAFLAGAFSLLCIGGSLGAGNMFQANQAYAQVSGVVDGVDGKLWGAVFGAGLAFCVGLVIVGGIRRIGLIAARLVPFMCGLYLLAGAFILLSHADQVLGGFGVIVRSAFAPDAAYGGFVGVLIQGFRRACFSNEAGVGSAPIAHSAARTEEPVREGVVALLEPFIDTIVVCAMTGLVIVVTGAYQQPGLEGIAMTSWAFESVFPWFKYVLSLSAVLFAFSTQISWSYYGERAWEYLFGERSTLVYKAIFLFFVWFGAISSLARVVDFSDLLLLAMAFPNLLGVILLSGRIDADLGSYLTRLRAGAFRRTP
ncbi:MAG: alanine:cation symporter family protein [Myxococcales bacterium]|nr:alanine:cation symporter family protein [Myxococcales bacterium]